MDPTTSATMQPRARYDYESTPLVQHADANDSSSLSKRVKYGVLATAVGFLLVVGAVSAGGFDTQKPQLGSSYPVGATGNMAHARLHHRAARVGLDASDSNVSTTTTSTTTSEAEVEYGLGVPEMVTQVKDLRDTNKELEEVVAALHSELASSRHSFAGGCSDEAVSALEAQNQDMYAELQRNTARKDDLYTSLLTADEAVSKCDELLAECVLQNENAAHSADKTYHNLAVEQLETQIKSLETDITGRDEEITMLIAELKARDDAKPSPFDFFCADEGETCECGHGDVVYAAVFHEDGTKYDLMTVLTGEQFVFAEGTDSFACVNEDFESDPAVGQTKGCFCAPAGLNAALASKTTEVTVTKYVESPPSPVIAPEETKCFSSQHATVPLCDCHSSCGTCGYSAKPTGEYDCITCASEEMTLTAVYDDGTGSCAIEQAEAPTPSVEEEADIPSSEFYAEAASDAAIIETAADDNTNQAHELSCTKYCSEEDTWDPQCLEHCVAVFNLCSQSCAAQKECCNHDFQLGSAQRLSCLQSCVIRVGFLTDEECQEQCEIVECHREIHGVTLSSCDRCDDLPAHAEYYGDAYHPNDYECQAQWGTNQQSCETGCRVGGELLDKYGHDYDYGIDAPSPEEVTEEDSYEHPPSPAEPAQPAEPNSPPEPSAPPVPPSPEPVSDVSYCGDSDRFSEGPDCPCAGGNIIFAQNNLDSLDTAVILGRFVKKHYGLNASAPWDHCYINEHFPDPSPGEPKGCWCVPTAWEPVHPPPSPNPPPPPPHPYPPPGDHPNFASTADLRTAIANCLSVGDGSGVKCCSAHGADCGVAGHADIPAWNVGGITDMSNLFQNAAAFNEDLSAWDVESVEDMSGMFANATSFNQDLSSWATPKLTTVNHMFYAASSFDNGLFADTAAVTNMAHCFDQATAFNNPSVGAWNVQQVVNMNGMFRHASSFNQNLDNWAGKVDKVEEMFAMFKHADVFDQDVSQWSTPAVKDTAEMFEHATSFKTKFSCGGTGGSDGPASACHVPVPPAPDSPSPPPPSQATPTPTATASYHSGDYHGDYSHHYGDYDYDYHPWGDYSYHQDYEGCRDDVPAEWTGPCIHYGTDDGCDCGYGVWDPDCDEGAQPDQVYNCDHAYEGGNQFKCVNVDGGTCEANGDAASDYYWHDYNGDYSHHGDYGDPHAEATGLYDYSHHDYDHSTSGYDYSQHSTGSYDYGSHATGSHDYSHHFSHGDYSHYSGGDYSHHYTGAAAAAVGEGEEKPIGNSKRAGNNQRSGNAKRADAAHVGHGKRGGNVGLGKRGGNAKNMPRTKNA